MLYMTPTGLHSNVQRALLLWIALNDLHPVEYSMQACARGKSNRFCQPVVISTKIANSQYLDSNAYGSNKLTKEKNEAQNAPEVTSGETQTNYTKYC